MFKNSVSKLPVDPNENDMPAIAQWETAFWLSIYLRKDADLGLSNLLTEYFGSNGRNFSTLGDGFLAQ